MKIKCYNCYKEFERNNVYGTYCPYCDVLIKPIEKPKFIEEREYIKEKMQQEILNKLKNRIKGEN